MTKYLLPLLVPILLYVVQAREVEEAPNYFHQVLPDAVYAQTEGCEQFSYDLRLTNLRNARNARDVQELPMWENSKMGGIFEEASEVDPFGFEQAWGNEGASSDGISAEEMGICYDCIMSGNPWDFLYQESISENSFGFQKYINGRNVEIDEPHMVDLKALGEKMALAYSNSPIFQGANGELRLFVPFATNSSGVVIANKLQVGGKVVSLPAAIQSSANYNAKVRDNFDPSSSDSKPGLCVIFYPINGNIPHDITPGSNSVTLGGASMSSYRNREVSDYNRNSSPKRYCPMPDWGYEGYYYADEKHCMENLIPKVNNGCRCRGGYDQLVCYNDKEVLVMDCALGAEGSIPIGPKEGIEPLKCDDVVLKMDGRVIDCCNPGTAGYAGRDIGYACSHAVKNPNFTETIVKNWSAGNSFTVTREPKK